jgi:putative nucleotidyltransferase with HDIG domain
MIESYPPVSGPLSLGQVLVVDDEPAMLRALGQAVSRLGYQAVCVTDPLKAVTLLSLRRFDAVITDLRLPMPSGGVFPAHVAILAPGVPLIVVTGVQDLGEIWDLLGESKVEAVIPKSAAKEGIARALARSVKLAKDEAMGPQGARLIADGLVRALALRDVETEAHSRRVAAWAGMLVRRLGVPSDEWLRVELGGLLHDIGKIGVSDTILKKPGKLTDEEWIEMRSHPELGCAILSGISALSGAMEIVRSHHERWDGTGYPDKLSKEAIPLNARIFSVTDTYDAVTADRPYRKGKPHAVALEVIRAESGRQFDPQVVAAFLNVAEAEWLQVARIFADHGGDLPGLS